MKKPTKKGRTFRVWVSKGIIEPHGGRAYVHGIIRSKGEPFNWYVPATLTLSPPKRGKK